MPRRRSLTSTLYRDARDRGNVGAAKLGRRAHQRRAQTGAQDLERRRTKGASQGRTLAMSGAAPERLAARHSLYRPRAFTAH